MLFLILLLSLSYQLKQFDPNEAYDNFFYSKAAYCSDQQINSWNGPPMEKINLINITVYVAQELETQGYIGYNPTKNQIVVAFRGSHNLQNWIANLNFLQTDYPNCENCKVHEGFLKDYKSMKSALISESQKLYLEYKDASFLVTGHSLGGVMATLLAIDLRPIIQQEPLLISYGCPRFGNKNFALYQESLLPNNQRIVHYRDMVPHLPPQNIIYEFIHGNTEIYYDDDMHKYNFIICKAIDGEEDDSCSNNFYFYNPYDHMNYFNMDCGCTDDSPVSIQQNFMQ